MMTTNGRRKMNKQYPWENIEPGHEKIASLTLPNNKQLYWTVSQKGLNGLMFKSQENIKKNIKIPTMDGFEFDLQSDEGETRFFINLKSFDSKDFFFIICSWDCNLYNSYSKKTTFCN